MSRKPAAGRHAGHQEGRSGRVPNIAVAALSFAYLCLAAGGLRK